ncbi:MAG: hypothetical protein EOP14_00945 [Pseudomonas sp.]|nr:MAG: hypothetical protein EOP14_00945 [Pseudomonas sp.]
MGSIDQATRAGDGLLVRDQASLALMRDLRVLLVDVIQTLEDDPAPHGGGRSAHGRECKHPMT